MRIGLGLPNSARTVAAAGCDELLFFASVPEVVQAERLAQAVRQAPLALAGAARAEPAQPAAVRVASRSRWRRVTSCAKRMNSSPATTVATSLTMPRTSPAAGLKAAA